MKGKIRKFMDELLTIWREWDIISYFLDRKRRSDIMKKSKYNEYLERQRAYDKYLKKLKEELK